MTVARLVLLLQAALWLTAAMPCHATEPPARIIVDPSCLRSIGGACDLDRRTFFGLCDQGTSFDERCRTPARYEYLVKENGITFGLSMNVVFGLERWNREVDPDFWAP